MLQAQQILPNTQKIRTRPFGLNVLTLRDILSAASSYKGSAHQDIHEALALRKDLVTSGLHLVGGRDKSMVDVDPQNAYKGLVKGLQYKEKYGRSFAAVMTSQAQSICILFPARSQEVLLFDSHSRNHSGIGQVGQAANELPKM